MLCLSTVIQITQIQLSITSWLWDFQWKPYIDIFPGRPPYIYTIWPAEVKSYSSCTAITHFLTPWTYLTKNHYENYSPKMVPIAKIWGAGSWTNWEVPLVSYARLFPPECRYCVALVRKPPQLLKEALLICLTSLSNFEHNINCIIVSISLQCSTETSVPFVWF